MDTAELIEAIRQEMEQYFGQDIRRINHALNVLRYARAINAELSADPLTVEIAAILHDIGIHEAERKYHSAAGNYQEMEGPPIARVILAGYSIPAATVDHICRIIANHHCAREIDTPEFRVVWDADWLVNIPDEFDLGDQAKMCSLLNVFKTAAGRRLAETQFVRS